MPNDNLTPRARRRRFGERGQSMVEFALILPIFILVVMATVDFGWALRSWIAVTNSVREGARYGATICASDSLSIPDETAAVKSRVVATSAGLVETADVTVSNCIAGRFGQNVVVSATSEYHYITPLPSLMGGLLPSSLHLQSSSNMRME
jgi:Flp pilus assembly protein TadG